MVHFPPTLAVALAAVTALVAPCANAFTPLAPALHHRPAPSFLRSVRAAAAGGPQTLYDKVFQEHVVTRVGDEDSDTYLLYIDRHLVHEVTSPQAFEGLRNAGRPVRRPDCTLVTADHNVPTSDRSSFTTVSDFIEEADSRTQVLALEDNIKEFGLTYFGLDDPRQGIVHIIGPEQGFTQPGMTIVCGDSHTATHGAFGSLAFGIGTSEVEHVLATQTLVQSKAKNMKVEIKGPLSPGVTSKDVILHVIGEIGTAGGTGSVIEFCGEAIEGLSMEARMSICNMAIEGGARAGMIAPDEITFEYLKGKQMAPADGDFDDAMAYWNSLQSDPGAVYDRVVTIDAKDIAPTATWGTSPQDVASIDGKVPAPKDIADPQRRAAVERALEYMGLEGGENMKDIAIDKVFIGSCTNGRIEDLRAVAAVASGRKVADDVYAMVVPGSGLVKAQAEFEGIDKVLKEAGFDWREPGCSMCLAMNPDKLNPKERCASTSNRNFEGRQGNGGRTHLVSPAMAAAAAVTGKLADIRDLDPLEPLPEPVAWPGAAPVELPVSRADSVDSAASNSGGGSGGSAGLPKFTQLKGIAAKLDIQNVDTDMIIPKQFLKTIKRTGLGVSAFYELRYDEEGSPRPEFVLNQPPYDQAKILVTGDNFGCGSSREHAPWSILDFGIRCIISTSFADIFYNNCFKNGMLPIKLPRDQVELLMSDADAGEEIEVDLEAQVIRRPNGDSLPFELDAFRRKCLVEGLDDIGITLQKVDDIATYEAKRGDAAPWVFNLQGLDYTPCKPVLA